MEFLNREGSDSVTKFITYTYANIKQNGLTFFRKGIQSFCNAHPSFHKAFRELFINISGTFLHKMPVNATLEQISTRCVKNARSSYKESRPKRFLR